MSNIAINGLSACENCQKQGATYPGVRCVICGKSICNRCSYLGRQIIIHDLILAGSELSPYFCSDHINEFSEEDGAKIDALAAKKEKLVKLQFYHFPYLFLLLLFIIPGIFLFISLKIGKNNSLTRKIEQILKKYIKYD